MPIELQDSCLEQELEGKRNTGGKYTDKGSTGECPQFLGDWERQAPGIMSLWEPGFPENAISLWKRKLALTASPWCGGEGGGSVF